MSAVVLSPHTDDAIFSLGEHLCAQAGVTVVAPLAGIPADPAGRRKHQTLWAEHARAMAIIGARYVNGPFLDDVYPPPDRGIFDAWLTLQLADAETVYIPLGIKHVDHVLVSNAAIARVLTHRPPTVRFYAELPYSTRYLHHARERRELIERLMGEYASQTDDALIAELLVPEQIWELS
ncbi:hypothetical protein [Nocardia sp. NPDC057030]|uniref:hypothetical protein n=1 Tax=unclassified Nocardia TaxID=2637762 RepID=UPI00363EF35D